MTKKVSVARLARSQAGYSLIEVMMTLGIMGCLASMAVFQISQSQPGAKADGAMRVVIAQLNGARSQAITQRRVMDISFTSPNLIQVTREEVPAPATTVLMTVPFESNVQYTLVAGLPDTPDAFGMHASVDFGSATKVRFNTDGSLIDQSGGILNGTLVLAFNNVPLSARAVTILGSTGRVRGYRWNGKAWVLV